jgi:hypothetical protein
MKHGRWINKIVCLHSRSLNPELYGRLSLEVHFNYRLLALPCRNIWLLDLIVCDLSTSVVQITEPRTVQQSPSYVSSGVLYGSSSMPMGMYGMNMGPSMFQSVNANHHVSSDQATSKGKSRESDFEAAFAQVAASLPPVQSESLRIVEVDDSVTDIEEALKNANLKSNTESDIEYGNDFKRCVPKYIIANSADWFANTGFGITFRTPTFHHPKKISQNGRLSSTS